MSHAVAFAADTVPVTTAPAPDAAALAVMLQNPVADLVSMQFENNFDFGVGLNSGTLYLLNMTAAYPANQKIGDLELSPFGMGGGSVGLPGDFTPPSRFVRMAFYLQNALPQKTTGEAVGTIFHFLNNFDIPPGAAMPPAGNSEKFPNYTSWTVVSDLAKNHYHFKTYGNPNVRVIDLAQALQAAGDKVVTVEMGPQDHESFTPSEVVTVKP